MQIYLIMGAIALIVILCLILNKVTEKTSFPTIILFLFIGIIIGNYVIPNFEYRDYTLTNKICNIALVFTIFSGGLSCNFSISKPVIPTASCLATLGVFFTTIIFGFLFHIIFKIDLIYTLLLAATIGSTDATTVFNILRKNKLNLKDNTASILEVESGANDPMAYTLTMIFIALIKGTNINIPQFLLLQFLIAIIFGFLFAYLVLNLIRKIDFGSESINVILILSFLLLTYSVTNIASGNGYLAVYLFGIYLGNNYIKDKNYIIKFFDSITNLVLIFVFFILGLVVHIENMSIYFPRAIVLYLILTFVARPIACALICFPFRCSVEQILFISFAGLRGASSICFAMLALVSLDNAIIQLFFVVVFMIVLISILFQGLLLAPLARKLNLMDNSVDVLQTFNDYQENSDIGFIKMKVKEDNILIGKMLKEIHFSSVRIAMIIRDDKSLVPKGKTVINFGDTLILSGDKFINKDNISFKEVFMTPTHEYCNKTITDIHFKTNESIVMIKRDKETIVPFGDFFIKPNDILVLATF